MGVIIETAFKIFIILRRYIEIESIEKDDEEEKESLIILIWNYFLRWLKIFLSIDIDLDFDDAEELTLLKDEFENIFGENNIVNQIGALGMDLIKTGFNTIESF
jgi:hypothetical protein